MTFSRAARSCIVALSLLASSTIGNAQMRVRITGPSGEPLPSSRVEVWSQDRRAHLLFSDEDGSVFLPRVDSTTSLVVRRMGYTPMTLHVSDVGTNGVIRLEAIALTLPQRAIIARRSACDRADQDVGRQLWLAIRSMYSRIPDGHGIAWRASSDSGLVQAAQVGDFDGMPHDSSGRLVGAAQIHADRARLAHRQYARALSTARGRGRERVSAWRTVPIDVYLADHLLSDDFGVSHRMTRQTSPQGLTLSFCPVDDRQGLRGEMRLNSDSSVAAVSYVVQTGERGAEPAAEVVFVPRPTRPGAAAYLLPAQSVAWWPSAVGKGWYAQRRLAFTRFEVRSCRDRRC